jgi:class 3 adenylate cyclase
MLGEQVGKKQESLLRTWYLKLRRGEEDEVPSYVRTRALNQPVFAMGVTLGMWVLAGISFGLLYLATASEIDWAGLGWSVLGVGGIAGPITSVIVYFANERVWRSELSVFFPHGKVTETPGFRMSVRRRMLILFAMTLMPLLLLAVLSHHQAVQIAHASRPETLLPRLLRMEIFLVSIGVLEVVVLSQTLGASLIEPLEDLGERMDAVQRGDLEARLTVTSNDELGRLAEGFNAMIEGLRREDVIRRLFSLYVTPEVAEHAIEHGARLGGQMIESTVLFSDIRGFTAMTEQMAPDALLALLNRYFDVMSEVIVDHGGFVNKFGGDSLLAVFGTPLNPTDDHPRRAVEAAQALLAALETFNQQQVTRNEPTVRIGVGIASGRVVVGNVGSSERLEYTVIGDAVNLASRLEAMTKHEDATVLLSGKTAAAVEGTMPLSPIGHVSVRGKQEPVDVYALRTSNLSTEELQQST